MKDPQEATGCLRAFGWLRGGLSIPANLSPETTSWLSLRRHFLLDKRDPTSLQCSMFHGAAGTWNLGLAQVEPVPQAG